MNAIDLRPIPRRAVQLWPCALMLAAFLIPPAGAQLYDQPERGQPGDAMIQDYLAENARAIEGAFLGEIKTAEEWKAKRAEYVKEYFHMLGLWPLPEKSDLKATVTRTLDRGDYKIEMLHYQSRPGLYVTANVYSPARIESGQRLPAVLYACGHSGRGRNGNKTAFQSHGIWFARHGYVCLMVDSLQLGEIAGIHHGTYRENRWWWISRGYTPAGVECWNGVRGIDYLISRPEVDPERIAVTGISGGGAATFWIAAADERVKIAAPVSGMADLVSYIPNRVINGHCDCMFLYNTHQWPWTRIAALIAPRPMLFVNSDKDPIFPMDANERVINRLERLYSLFGAGDQVDAFVSIGGHDYRKDILQGVYRFCNAHLKNDLRPVEDSEVDLVTGNGDESHPIPPQALRVFPTDADIPADARNRSIDREFVPMAKVEMTGGAGFESWKAGLLQQMRQQSFPHFPERVPAARLAGGAEALSLETEDGITVSLRQIQPAPPNAKRIALVLGDPAEERGIPAGLSSAISAGDAAFLFEPRGYGSRRWSQKNPPNYVERSAYLLGRTSDSGRIWDIAAIARYLRGRFGPSEIVLVGKGRAAGLAVYAALLEPDIDTVILHDLPASHMDAEAPVLLNILRVCDLEHAVAMLAPRRVHWQGEIPPWRTKK